MTVVHLEILVEEPSMEAALRALLPRFLQETTFGIYPYQGKDELLARLPERLRGYAAWLPQNWRIVVLVDRDDDDCEALKQQMESIAAEAGLRTRTAVGAMTCQLVNRIAVEELEAWYFGDWEAVRAAYPRVPTAITKRSRYRDPDGIVGGTWETFERVMQESGYFLGGLRKVEAARHVGPHLLASRSTSHSFKVFAKAISDFLNTDNRSAGS
jgi:hypothetical protein